MQQKKGAPKKEKNNLKGSLNQYLKFSGLGLQMAVLIGGGAYAGKWADARYNSCDTAWFTLAGTFLGLVLAMYFVLKTINQQDSSSWINPPIIYP